MMADGGSKTGASPLIEFHIELDPDEVTTRVV